MGWSGKCPNCGQWGTLEEMPESMQSSKKDKAGSTSGRVGFGINNDYPVMKLSDKSIENSDLKRFSTGFDEFNRVLGGGVVPGEVILISGEPGIGKSTLLLQVAGKVAMTGKKVLYIAGEESAAQIKARFIRFSSSKVVKYTDDIIITEQTDVASISAIIEKESPELVIIDSIQTISSDLGRGYPGSMSQMRICAGVLSKVAKQTGAAIFLVGQINKEGLIAGPKIVEHMVDCVVYIEGDQFNVFRLVRTLKNRFGATNEIGVFEMAQEGMKEVTNPSEVFIQEMQETSGSAIGAILKGSRVVFVEVQALVVERGMESGPLRRVANGIKKPRLDMICAVLTKRGGVFLGDKDVFVNVAGGLTVDDPIIDVSVCAAIKSAVSDKALGKKTVYVGEVGLGGEIRSFYGLKAVVKEAKRLGYTKIIASDTTKSISSM